MVVDYHFVKMNTNDPDADGSGPCAAHRNCLPSASDSTWALLKTSGVLGQIKGYTGSIIWRAFLSGQSSSNDCWISQLHWNLIKVDSFLVSFKTVPEMTMFSQLPCALFQPLHQNTFKMDRLHVLFHYVSQIFVTYDLFGGCSALNCIAAT